MVRFGSSKSEGGFFALFDIASTSIGVSLVQGGVVPTILWSKRLEFSFTGTEEYSRYVRTMYATLLEAGMKMISEGVKTVSRDVPSFSVRSMRVYCVLANPWYFGAVSRGSESKEKKFLITPLEIQSLETQASELVQERQDLASWQDVMGTSVSFELQPLSFFLNGYATRVVMRRTAQECDGEFYCSYISESVQKNIDEVISRVLPNHAIEYYSSAYVLSSYPHSDTKKNFILCEVTGEITQIFLFKRGILNDLVTVPKGSNHILKSQCPNALTVEEAKSAIEVLIKKKQVTFETLPESLQGELREWKSACIKGINQIAKGVTAPRDFVLFSEGVWGTFYRTLFEKGWELPGVRTEVEVSLKELKSAVEPKDTSISRDTDSRLSTFAILLPFCTNEKGVWYTKK